MSVAPERERTALLFVDESRARGPLSDSCSPVDKNMKEGQGIFNLCSCSHHDWQGRTYLKIQGELLPDLTRLRRNRRFEPVGLVLAEFVRVDGACDDEVSRKLEPSGERVKFTLRQFAAARHSWSDLGLNNQVSRITTLA